MATKTASKRVEVSPVKPSAKKNKKIPVYTAHTNGASQQETIDSRYLYTILTEVKNGNFNVRMPIDQTGLNGKICDTLNEIISLNEKMMQEFTRAGNTIGQQGKLTQRIEVPNAQGAWSTGVDSLNTLISDLVHPIIEIAQVISSVAKGDLSKEMPLEIGGHNLRGEFARIAKEVNDMVKQLNLFSMEVTRVAREVGSEGKLGGQAKVKGVGGVWKDLTDSVNQMGSNLTAQVRNIAEVTTAVAKEDLSKKPINPDLLKAKVAVFIDLYNKNQQLIIQEQKIQAINNNLQNEIKQRIDFEAKITLLNRKLLKNIKSLEKANRELDHFAFIASHDLQEPLRKIKTFCDRFYRNHVKQLGSDDLKDIQRINIAANRMQVLINDLLDFSKLNAEIVEFRQISLMGLVSEVIEDLEPLILEKNVSVQVDDLPILPVHERLMKPVFSNLLNNSIKYARKNVSPVIHIYSESPPDNETLASMPVSTKYCRIYVKDNGIGFNQQYAEQIFEMFKRLHNSRDYEGTGVGLALCKRIMEKHHGFISAISDENVGSTFILSIPLQQPVFQK